MMKNTMIAGVAAFALAAPAYAALETEIHAGYHTIYEFRGVDLGDDLYEAGIDLSYELIEGLELSGGVWYADNDAGDELDLYVGLTKSIGPVDLSVGYIYYNIPEGSAWDTDEFYLGLSHELACGIGLALTYYEDVDEIDAGYLEFEVTKSIELSECLALDIAAGAAWSFDYNADVDGTSLDDFNHWHVSLALPWELKEDVTLSPYVKYVDATSSLDNDFGATASDDLFFGGVVLSIDF
jgi:uncharacterized protein (TIGR02001 family)